MSVSYDYDTAAIRREARKVKSCASKIEDTAMRRLSSTRLAIDGEFIGQTADALDDSLSKMQKKLKSLNSDLNSLYSALMRYADSLEEADERVSKLFSK
ncbi:MAG: WXG100 family type VII secretion target [Clostridia bacterium]|nr:WXG100 family type VII secretion target [Clostridia bacterium]